MNCPERRASACVPWYRRLLSCSIALASMAYKEDLVADRLCSLLRSLITLNLGNVRPCLYTVDGR